MSLLENRKREMIEQLSVLPDPAARLEYLIEEARAMPALPPSHKIEENLVEGCLSNLWFVAEIRDGRCWFSCDSDSLVVKSIAGLLCRFYSGADPADILAHDPSFLKEVGITAHLSANRRNALTRVWSRIRAVATAAAASKSSTSAAEPPAAPRADGAN